MAQHKKGLVAVVNGSNEVIGTDTGWLSAEIKSGDLFVVTGYPTFYEVAAVVSDTQLLLSAPYGGDTAENRNYAISRDFTPFLSIPYPEPGDIETAALFRRAVATIEEQLLSRDSGLTVIAERLADPPSTAGLAINTSYIVAAPATGAWLGRENDIATWDGTKWLYATPRDGWKVNVRAENYDDYLYDEDVREWVTGPGIGSGTAAQQYAQDAAQSAAAAAAAKNVAVASMAEAQRVESTLDAKIAVTDALNTQAIANQQAAYDAADAAAQSAAEAATTVAGITSDAAVSTAKAIEAAASAAAAAAASAAALASEAAAGGSAAAAASDRTAVAGDLALTNAARDVANARAQDAADSAAAALASETAAAVSASTATTKAAEASASAASAATSATAAGNSAGNAANSASAASVSEAAAGIHAATASTKADEAAASTAAALASKTAAANSAAAALTSQNAAADSAGVAANNAATSTTQAGTATTKAAEAAASATAAAASATLAGQRASAAAASATDAAGSAATATSAASTASTLADQALASKNSAASSAATATTKAAEAAVSATSAAAAASAAADSATFAHARSDSAQISAADAAASKSAAAASATTATQEASDAQMSADAAALSATSAAASAVDADNSAQAAAGSATQAQASAASAQDAAAEARQDRDIVASKTTTAELAAANASASAQASAASATDALASKLDTIVARDAAVQAAADLTAAVTKAQALAQQAEDVQVDPGVYSAFHWSRKAKAEADKAAAIAGGQNWGIIGDGVAQRMVAQAPADLIHMVGGLGITVTYEQSLRTITWNIDLGSSSGALAITPNETTGRYDINLVQGNISHQSIGGAGTKTHAEIDAHLAATGNVHGVAADQIAIDADGVQADTVQTAIEELADGKLPAEHAGTGGSAHAAATIGAAGFMSAFDKIKLDGIETGANLYEHPASHPASMIVEEVDRRFLTDAERAKLAGVQAGANLYEHPASHPASMIMEEATRRFFTDIERDKLAGIQPGANLYVHPAADGDLHVPATGSESDGKFLKAGATPGAMSWTAIAWDDVTGKPTTLAAAGITDAVNVSQLGAPGGVATLGGDSKVLADQLPALDYIPNADRGAAGGVATLGLDSKVVASQLPDLDYAPASHATDTNNPHAVTAAQIGAIPAAEKGAPGGVPVLGLDGKVVANQIPAIAVTNTFECDTLAERDALTGAEEGDVAIVQDRGDGLGETFIMTGDGSWKPLLTPGGVASFNGRGGFVTPQSGDYVAAQITFGTTGSLSSTTVQDAIAEIAGMVASHEGTGGESHAEATAALAGFMSATDKAKLDGVQVGANFYEHPTGDGYLHVPPVPDGPTGGLVLYISRGAPAWGSLFWNTIAGKPSTLDGYGIIDAVQIDHVGAGGLAHSIATSDAAGFMPAEDKAKLDAASHTNTASTVVMRDADGNFAAGTITAALNGKAADSDKLGGKTAAEFAPRFRPIVTTSDASYSVGVSDAGAYIRCTSLNPASFVVPSDASVNLPVGTEIDVIQAGTGQITVSIEGSTTINSKANRFKTAARWSAFTLKKVGPNEWDLMGDLVA